MAGERWDEQVGSVAEEAQRLVETLRRAGGGRPAPEAPDGDPASPGPDPDPAVGDGWTCTDPFCRACPLCRTVAVVRELSPETLRRLADLAAVAATVLTDLAAQRGVADPPAPGPAPAPHGGAPVPPPAPRSGSPIPVRDADEEEVTGD